MANRPKGISRKQEQAEELRKRRAKAGPKMNKRQRKLTRHLRGLVKQKAHKELISDWCRDGLALSDVDAWYGFALATMQESYAAELDLVAGDVLEKLRAAVGTRRRGGQPVTLEPQEAAALLKALECGAMSTSAYHRNLTKALATGTKILETHAYIQHVEVPGFVTVSVQFPGLPHLSDEKAERLGTGDKLVVG